MRYRFTIRDLLWLTAVVGLSVALWISRRNLADLNERYSTLEQSTSAKNLATLISKREQAEALAKQIQVESKKMAAELNRLRQ